MNWFLYILRTDGERLYVGVTPNLIKRWHTHKSGKGAKFTRAFSPIEVVFVKNCENRSEAQVLEARYKKLTTNQKWHRVLAQFEGDWSDDLL